MLLADFVRHGAAVFPDRAALLADGVTITFAELEGRIDQAIGTVRRRFPASATVAVLSENSIDFVVAAYALPSAGNPAVFVNTRLSVDEAALALAESQPQAILCSPELLERGTAIADGLGAADAPPAVLNLASWLTDPPTESLAEPQTDTAGEQTRPTGPTEGDVAWLIHTSGSTGVPKTVMLTHAGLRNAVLNTALGRPMSDDDTYLFCFPLFHVAAYNVLHAHLRGLPVVLLRKFVADEVIEAVVDHGANAMSLAPTMVAMLLDHPRTAELHGRLRSISYGAASMSPTLLRRAHDAWGSVFAQGYGMTEASGNAVFLSPEDHRRALSDHPGLLEAAGRPGPLIQVSIRDDGGNPATTNTEGEIWLRGPQLAAGYLGRPDLTEVTFVDGWLRTGDIGRIDTEGYLFVVDRLKDIVITGGENVASREVEDILGAHPLVRAVAVIGTPDDRWGEAICAVIEARDDCDATNLATDLIEWSRDRLSGFKRPRRVELIDRLPTNASGKIDKPALRRRFAQK